MLEFKKVAGSEHWSLGAVGILLLCFRILGVCLRTDEGDQAKLAVSRSMTDTNVADMCPAFRQEEICSFPNLFQPFRCALILVLIWRRTIAEVDCTRTEALLSS